MSVKIVAQNETESTEVWRLVPDFGGRYSVSSEGRIRSEKFARGRGRAGGGRVLKPWLNKGYQYIKATKFGQERQKSFAVHQLVALSFIGECPDGFCVNHKNCNKQDNRPENLEYVTQAGNVRHARRNGHYSNPPVHRGERHHGAKLNEIKVKSIRASYANGKTIRQLMTQHNVTDGCIRQIVNRQTWSHI